MPSFPVSPEKEKELLDRMVRLGVAEGDLRETFVRSSGPGGQNVNKVATCVQLVHLPTGLTVRCSRERSQALNRFLARRLLLDRIERMREGLAKAERMRRAKEKILADKHAQAEKKARRRKNFREE